ncbi:Chemotaxis protein CheW [Pseudomonas syringae pv. delphinii]|uniref:Chemotaxis protein CheW n=2 Tax=Pseudomonas syringae group genomosp. 3 TaxID=251701 RepID=A0A0P9QAJ0_9PSED|nr:MULTISPECIES: CheW domain-containing protein [Pseudomonas syringae group]KPX27980.1 Chemotaxis protein CheW [Pseudomonas syringae pv. delphinii]RMP17338.1 Chemotaxis protein CheW [Pseudomonas syringae pv. delphinii]RMP27454.1 Chemotaxis protein CheW [Pseudomonas syringae pv. delphinii]RMQ20718.1 Chemotaxis protein CheW [Pseudomonas syringae pv. delphinii]RMR13927.1 Chemotaxis protein CheW [Pseudomonas syringae pv. primulae]
MLHFWLGPGMNRPLEVATRPKLALQSYLDALLYDATEELEEPSSSIDDFQAAVLEEQAFDARMQAQIKPLALAVAAPAPVAVAVKVAAPVAVVEVAPVIVAEAVQVVAATPTVERVEPVAELSTLVTQRTPTPPPTSDGRPAWAAEPFECLLFDVAGLTLAVPLVCLGSIYPLAGQELTPLFGQPDWFLGILPSQAGNLKVLDTARWIMPDRYRDDFRQGLQYVISVQGYEWGLAVHQVSRSLRLDPNEIKWRTQRGQRPWLAGTVIEHMCALLDVAELAELIASGAVKQLNRSK